ncbi:MAG: hypothetical protein OXG11_06800 [Chloroflexi bacterium]|nr:hypothetical protein [Chloroflexota bacterium]
MVKRYRITEVADNLEIPPERLLAMAREADAAVVRDSLSLTALKRIAAATFPSAGYRRFHGRRIRFHAYQLREAWLFRATRDYAVGNPSLGGII